MAIAGLGTDIVEIARLGKGDGANERLAKRVLTPAEWQQFSEHSTPVRFLAKRFAAKEAVYKALSATPVRGLGWHDAEILKIASGAPILTLSSACKTALEAVTPEGYKATVNLSLSDEPPYAVAFVVISAGPSDGPQE